MPAACCMAAGHTEGSTENTAAAGMVADMAVEDIGEGMAEMDTAVADTAAADTAGMAEGMAEAGTAVGMAFEDRGSMAEADTGGSAGMAEKMENKEVSVAGTAGISVPAWEAQGELASAADMAEAVGMEGSEEGMVAEAAEIAGIAAAVGETEVSAGMVGKAGISADMAGSTAGKVDMDLVLEDLGDPTSCRRWTAGMGSSIGCPYEKIRSNRACTCTSSRGHPSADNNYLAWNRILSSFARSITWRHR